MYEINRQTRLIRDPAAGYGHRWIDDEAFPAATALDDLRSAAPSELSRVLTRFAALRYWLLTSTAAPAPVLDHAREAALAHLDSCDPEWSEASTWRDVLGRDGDVAPFRLALSAARSAEAEGHLAGAFATLRGGFVIARRRGRSADAAALARGLAGFTGRLGDRTAADRWKRRAEWLERETRDSGPRD